SPLAVDFGEQDNDPSVLIVTAGPGVRADARPVPVTGGRPLRTLRGTLDQVIAEGEQAGDAYLRVGLAEPGRAGVGDGVGDRLRNPLRGMPDEAPQPRPGGRGGDRTSRIGRSPRELFAGFLAEQNVDAPRLTAMFAELLDEVTSDPAAAMTG